VDYSRDLFSRDAVQWCEDGGIKDHRNLGILAHHYTASQPIRPRLEGHLFAKFMTEEKF
jgi:hypothetical protein